MKRTQSFLGYALVLGGIGLLAGGCGHWQSVAHGATARATISKDDPDNEEGDNTDEGTGVVDPVPQDDGSDGVDDGSGDA
jgi:hypothetical protein